MHLGGVKNPTETTEGIIDETDKKLELKDLRENLNKIISY